MHMRLAQVARIAKNLGELQAVTVLLALHYDPANAIFQGLCPIFDEPTLAHIRQQLVQIALGAHEIPSASKVRSVRLDFLDLLGLLDLLELLELLGLYPSWLVRVAIFWAG